MAEELLLNISIAKWIDLQEIFKKNWPRNICAHSVLETQMELNQKGLGYGFEVYCPSGDVSNGMVAINDKKGFYEIIIHTPTEDTTAIEEALRGTKIINWDRPIIIPFAPKHIIQCVSKVVQDVNVVINSELPSQTFFLSKDTSLFDVTLPEDITLDFLSLEHVDMVNSTWPHKYATSSWYFALLIKSKLGYGLFKDNQLISWAFINEAGTLCHMFTLEEHRRKKYAEILLKIVCNIIFKNNKDVFIYCVKGNVSACNLYKKVGCVNIDPVSWLYLKHVKTITKRIGDI